MSTVRVAAIQMACSDELQDNLAAAERLLRAAAGQGAQIILLPELFTGSYFCKRQRADYFAWAAPPETHPAIQTLQPLAAELEVVLPVSFFERSGSTYFNSVAVLDADGSSLGVYRKSHLPDGPGYQEKYYFTPGDSGFKVWSSRYAKIGVGICWDQWFPEAARCMCLDGAELLLYPTAIGSEPEEPEIDSQAHWQTVMCGHAGANMTPVIAANRIGCERDGEVAITFYGSSFIAGWDGQLLAHAGREQEAVIQAEFDLSALHELRAGWGLFRDRRPELYRRLLKH